MHIHLRLHRTDLLPKDDAGLADWCMQRWSEKEALLAHLQAKGEFPSSPSSEYHGVREARALARSDVIRSDAI